MEISVQLFAGLREVMESDLLTVKLDQDIVSVASLRQALEEQYPKLKPYL
jgi:molybdopterin converting factor small subunit